MALQILRKSGARGTSGTLSGCMGCSLVKSVLFVYGIIKRIVYRAPKRYLNTKTRLRLWLPKATKVTSSR